jgi:hypothetical protein
VGTPSPRPSRRGVLIQRVKRSAAPPFPSPPHNAIAGHDQPGDRAGIGRAFQHDGAGQQLRHPISHRQAHTNARGALRIGAVKADKWLANGANRLRINAPPAVPHFKCHAAIIGMIAMQFHRARGWRGGHRILQQIGQRAGDQESIHEQHQVRVARTIVQGNAGSVGDGLYGLNGHRDQGIGRNSHGLRPHQARFQLHQQRDPIHRGQQHMAAVMDILRVLHIAGIAQRPYRLRPDQIGKAQNGVQRRTQFVTHVGQTARKRHFPLRHFGQLANFLLQPFLVRNV